MSRTARLRIYIVPFVLIAVVLVALIRAGLAERADDPMYQADVQTHRLLANFERTGHSTELRAWLAHADGGPGMETYICLIEWACKNQDKFIHLMDAMPAKEQEHASKLLVSMARDSGREADFVTAFQGYESPVVNGIVKEIEKHPISEWGK